MITRSAGQSQPTCHTYLLKIWREGDQENEPLHAWRFTLEYVQAGMRTGFSDLDSLLIYLQDLTRINSSPAEEHPAGFRYHLMKEKRCQT